MAFEEITAAAIGTMYRCEDCKAVVGIDERDTHSCRFPVKFTDRDVRQWCLEALRWHLVRVREMRDEELKRNDELRAQGVPFSKRREQVNMRKIEWCDEQEQMIIKTGQSFRVRDQRAWWDEGSYFFAERMSMQIFIRWFVFNIVEHVPQQDYGQGNEGGYDA